MAGDNKKPMMMEIIAKGLRIIERLPPKDKESGLPYSIPCTNCGEEELILVGDDKVRLHYECPFCRFLLFPESYLKPKEDSK